MLLIPFSPWPTPSKSSRNLIPSPKDSKIPVFPVIGPRASPTWLMQPVRTKGRDSFGTTVPVTRMITRHSMHVPTMGHVMTMMVVFVYALRRGVSLRLGSWKDDFCRIDCGIMTNHDSHLYLFCILKNASAMLISRFIIHRSRYI